MRGLYTRQAKYSDKEYKEREIEEGIDSRLRELLKYNSNAKHNEESNSKDCTNDKTSNNKLLKFLLLFLITIQIFCFFYFYFQK